MQNTISVEKTVREKNAWGWNGEKEVNIAQATSNAGPPINEKA